MWKFYNKFLIFLLWIMKIRLVTALASAVLCARIPGLSPIQRQLCAEAPDALIALGDGHRLGAQECQHQFRGHRWNCSQVWQKGVFGHIMFIGSREAAFTYAVASAGAVHAVTASCARGNISLCGCEMMQKTTHDYANGRQQSHHQQQQHHYYHHHNQQQQQLQSQQQQMHSSSQHSLRSRRSSGTRSHQRSRHHHRSNRSLNKSSSHHGVKYKSTESTFEQQPWKWGGCSVDINFGIKFARKFLDVREIEGDERSLMNLHNNRVGRRIVKKLLRLECKCHGVSGSCVMKTCWNSLPPFRLIGDVLMKKYEKAKLVQAINSTNGLKLVLKRSDRFQRHPKKYQLPKRMEMVYIESSPNYCERNLTLDSLGTNDRKCNRTAQGIDGCDLLCCGRGYNTHQINRSWQCRCKFQWCCNVQCEECHEHYEEYTCK